ncbi:IclR family transcriptional regulator [Humibacter ginsengisoli]
MSRAVRILDILGEAAGAVTLSELARALGAAKSSTLNVCGALEEGGLIRRTEAGYQLGRRIVELGGDYLRSFDPVLEFYRACAESEVLSNERCQLAVLDGTNVLYLATHVGRAPFRFSAGIGSKYPASITAVGVALLSHLPDSEIATRFADEATRPSFTDRSVTDLDALRRKLAETRERGYSIDHGEVYPGLAGVAVVVPPQSSGEVPIALGASLVESRASATALHVVVDALREVADRMSNPMNLQPEALRQATTKR